MEIFSLDMEGKQFKLLRERPRIFFGIESKVGDTIYLHIAVL